MIRPFLKNRLPIPLFERTTAKRFFWTEFQQSHEPPKRIVEVGKEQFNRKAPYQVVHPQTHQGMSF